MNIYEAADAFRAQAVARDRAAAVYMARTYAEVQARLERQVAQVVAKLEAAREAGTPISPAWPYQEARARALLAQAERELAVWQDAAGVKLRDELSGTAVDAFDAAQGLVDLNTPTGAAQSTMRLPRDAVLQAAGATSPSSPLTQLLGSIAGDAASAMATAMTSGIAAGRNPRAIGRDLVRASRIPLWRGELIARTETMRTWRAVTTETYRQVNAQVGKLSDGSDLVRGWRWWSALDRRTCPSCWAQHGSVHPLTETMATHPNCRCVAIPATATWAELGIPGMPETPQATPGPQLFDRLAEADQRIILGPSKLAAYKARQITLGDLVERGEHPAWGPTSRTASLRRARENARLRKATPDTPPGTAPNVTTPRPAPTPRDLERLEAALPERVAGRSLTDDHRAWVADGRRLLADAGVKVPRGQRFAVSSSDKLGLARGDFAPVTGPKLKAGMPHELRIASRGNLGRDQVVTTFHHELGHGMDYTSAPGTKFASRSSKADHWTAFRSAAGDTGTVQDLNAAAGETARYLRDPAEVWARAFQQYVAARSDRALFARLQAGVGEAGSDLRRYWPDSEWPAVEAAVERVLRREGWL